MTQKQIDADFDKLQQRIAGGIYKYGSVMNMPDYDQILEEIKYLSRQIPDEQPYLDAFEEADDLEK